MVSSVNKTALHPSGVIPSKEHTEIEEELHEKANIDYDRVAIVPNPSVAALYEDALVYETGSAITSSGALTAYSGAKTGRSPLDKRIVKEEGSEKNIWWGPVNKPMSPEVWRINRERAVDYLNTRNRIYVIDGFAGWDERYRISVRVVCARAYHALFMRNMLIRPTRAELDCFHPDYVIYNAGTFPANRYTEGMTSATSVAINFAEREMVILGTEYAGEMKKGVFTVLFYEMPVKHGVLTLHSSANEGKNGDVTVFFGLSGTGKTTLSADPNRALIGDDEHCWSDRGVFNIEGGCYAKCIGLSAEKEPDIHGAIRFGSVLENVVFNPETRVVDYDDATLTENTRCAYPIEYITNAKIPCLSLNHPSNIILLTCDARGVLPPISKLTTDQTMFHFISGYTSKMAGTEDGVTEPQATFSSCFAQPFLALHPMRYAKMLADKIAHHKANAWLLNTGWVGAGATKGGKRCPLKYTRAILDAIHSGELAKAEYEVYDTFNLFVPTAVTGVPSELLNPKRSWTTGESDFKEEVTKLGTLFVENFKKYSDEATPEVIKAGGAHCVPSPWDSFSSDAGHRTGVRHQPRTALGWQRICRDTFRDSRPGTPETQNAHCLVIYKGRVTSFYGPDLQTYTSLKAHSSAEGAVRQLLFNDRGVISIAAKSAHMSLRRGLAQWNIIHDSMKDLRCMSYTSKGNSEVLVAGLQNTMFTIDVDRGQVTREIATEDNYTMMKRSRYICAATTSGSVNMLDPNTFKVIKTWKAHAAAISDMDAQNNFLVTCGYSPRHQQSYMLDPLANVYDLRMLRPLPPIPFHAGAAFVRMHPKMSTTSIVASQNGQLQVVDLMNPNTVNLRQANVSSYLTALELAPSGDALALADADCSIHLWGSPEKLRFSEFSNPAELPDVPTSLPQIEWTAETLVLFSLLRAYRNILTLAPHDRPLSSIGLPHYREQLLSAWPSHLVFEVGNPPAKIDPDVLTSMTPTDFGGWAPNPKRSRRNQVENTRVVDKASVPLMAPKFLSEKARESAANSGDGRRASDAGDALGDTSVSGMKADVPAMYRNVEIKYSKFGVDDFDFEFYNKTKYSGLEIHIANSYSNPLLQLFKFTPLLRNLALHHTATNCLTETCLLCEMGFLFDMLDKAGGQNCQATNFLKTFSSIPQASALGLLEEDSPNGSLALMIQAVNRFLLERISIDYKHVLPQSPLLDQTLATVALTGIRCVKCNSETVRPGSTYVNELVYPQKNMNKPHIRGPRPTFSQILKASVERENQTRGWCDKCRRYQSLATRKSIQDIPHVLMINAAVNTPDAKELWAAPGWLPDEIGVIVEGGQFFCYEGEDLRLHLQRGIHYITVYELVGLVADINSGENQASHLVSLVNGMDPNLTMMLVLILEVALSARERQTDSQWHLFNDFLVRKVTKEDAIEFSPTWKIPSVLAYQTKTASNAVDDSWKEMLDTSLLYFECSLSQRNTSRGYQLLSPQIEAPRAGTHVAIDAEFVALQQEEIEIKADGSRETIRPSRLGLARVSVLRGTGIDEGLPFIDDYIVTNEPVVDYLTAFSGIRAGDLDPKRSEHNLVPLKVAYKKLWLLLNLGCVFIGHGLPKDFRTINIHVPKNQVIDTVDLFFIKSRQRKLSLRFLSWLLLKEDIQLETHDSIEDARTALKLYRKYEEFQDAGILEPMLNDIYAKGREVNYKAPSAQKIEGGTVDRRDTPPILRDGAAVPKTPIKREAGLSTAQGQSWTTGSGGYFASPLR